MKEEIYMDEKRIEYLEELFTDYWDVSYKDRVTPLVDSVLKTPVAYYANIDPNSDVAKALEESDYMLVYPMIQDGSLDKNDAMIIDIDARHQTMFLGENIIKHLSGQKENAYWEPYRGNDYLEILADSDMFMDTAHGILEKAGFKIERSEETGSVKFKGDTPFSIEPGEAYRFTELENLFREYDEANSISGREIGVLNDSAYGGVVGYYSTIDPDSEFAKKLESAGFMLIYPKEPTQKDYAQRQDLLGISIEDQMVEYEADKILPLIVDAHQPDKSLVLAEKIFEKMGKYKSDIGRLYKTENKFLAMDSENDLFEEHFERVLDNLGYEVERDAYRNITIAGTVPYREADKSYQMVNENFRDTALSYEATRPGVEHPKDKVDTEKPEEPKDDGHHGPGSTANMDFQKRIDMDR